MMFTETLYKVLVTINLSHAIWHEHKHDLPVFYF